MDYDPISDEYAAHRRIHQPVLQELCDRCGPGPTSTVLEVGCGTGNYSRALAVRHDYTVVGLELSAGMLAHANTHSTASSWVQGQAEHLGFAKGTFDLVFSVDLIHHVIDRQSYFHHAARILGPGGWVCTVTDSAEIIRRREILSGYFPETVEVEVARYPRIRQLMDCMEAASLVDLDIVTVEEPYEISNAQPFHDKSYSALHLITEEAWRAGVKRLEHDLSHRPVYGSSRYACVWGRKQ